MTSKILDEIKSPGRVLALGRGGSHSYGTNIESSDEDFRGIFVQPTSRYLSFAGVTEDYQCSKPYDVVMYDIRKYFRLASGANPNVLELMFLDKSDYLDCHPAFMLILDNRQRFLSKKVQHTFTGYARSQLARLKGHYKWLKSPPTSHPTRAEFGLAEVPLIPKDQRDAMFALVEDKIKEWDPDLESLSDADRLSVKLKFRAALSEAASQDLEVAAAKCVGMDSSLIDILRKERAFKAALKEFASYEDWKKNRNKVRSELEARSGYDTKHAMHLVRLMKMCVEILETGTLQVKRPDAKELLEIRNGRYSYEEIIALADDLDYKVTQAVKTTKLPASVDMEFLDTLCTLVISKMNGRET
jgi:predicted nucleotidyltransferase